MHKGRPGRSGRPAPLQSAAADAVRAAGIRACLPRGETGERVTRGTNLLPRKEAFIPPRLSAYRRPTTRSLGVPIVYLANQLAQSFLLV